MKLIIHHWDADGIASAVLYTRINEGNFSYFTPEIGNYFIDGEDKRAIKSFNCEEAVLLDMSLPEEDLNFLNFLFPFRVIDHHQGKKVKGIDIYNPTIEGKGEYLSNTLVLSEAFSLPHSELVYLGIYGDAGFKLKKGDKTLKEIKGFFGKNFGRFKRSVKIVDIQYKTGDRERVYSAVRFLLENSLLSILSHKDFADVERMIDEEKKKEIKKLKMARNTNFLFTSSRFRIVSDLARSLYSLYPNKINVVLGLQGKRYNFYLRTGHVDLSLLVKKAKDLGYFAGGKVDVIGVVLEKKEAGNFVNLVEDFFGKMGISLGLKDLFENFEP